MDSQKQPWTDKVELSAFIGTSETSADSYGCFNTWIMAETTPAGNAG
jgi:hypothetical protein